ncbi:MAG: hypothetical protein AB7P03_09125 [Kofleriaceae bacterium]
MITRFVKLNHGWNAEPNAPDPVVRIDGQTVILTFEVNTFKFADATPGRAELVFSGCWRYRLGGTNDEGWYAGQCRFSHVAPAWGEFYEVMYEVDGDLQVNRVTGWRALGPPIQRTRHFLFYFRDETFECDANEWTATFPR